MLYAQAPRCVVLFLFMSALAANVYAVDGITLIDQTRALAGNVTPGDAPGFPVSITQPGSYKLSGNLTVAATGVSAIEIAASNVTLDLNGFTIAGPPQVCGGSCTPVTFGVGVPLGSALHSVTVRNGTITGFDGQIVLRFITRGLAEDLIMFGPRDNTNFLPFANSIGPGSVARHVITDAALVVYCPSVVVESAAVVIARQGTAVCVLTSNAVGVP